jgi:hypothetical protein
MAKKYVDSAIAPIIAFDFDDTINVNGRGKFPACGEVRKFAKETINFLHSIGCKIVIWTSRDVAYNQEEKKMYDHLTPMLDFLDREGIEYDAINKSVQFAPYHYNGRKVYAHLYVDDRAFGWHESESIMIDVLMHILTEIIGIEMEYAICIRNDITNGRYVHLKQYAKDKVEMWATTSKEDTDE